MLVSDLIAAAPAIVSGWTSACSAAELRLNGRLRSLGAAVAEGKRQSYAIRVIFIASGGTIGPRRRLAAEELAHSGCNP